MSAVVGSHAKQIQTTIPLIPKRPLALRRIIIIIIIIIINIIFSIFVLFAEDRREDVVWRQRTQVRAQPGASRGHADVCKL